MTTDGRLFLLMAMLALSGCTSAPEQTAKGIALSAGGGSGEVQEISLKDGTPCAVVIGYGKAAISCGWRNTR